MAQQNTGMQGRGVPHHPRPYTIASQKRLRDFRADCGILLVALCRPFAWKGGVYLSHWLSLPPSQDRVALAKLDLEHNSLSFVYRFDTLEDELAKLKGLKARTHERSTSTLEQVCCCSRGHTEVPRTSFCWSTASAQLHAASFVCDAQASVYLGRDYAQIATMEPSVAS